MLSLPIGRRGASKILFYAESPVKYAMFRPIQRLMAEDARIQFFFAGRLRGGVSSRRMAATLGVEGARPIRRGLSALCAFDLFVTADYDIWGAYEKSGLPIGRTPRVQIFHGASVRNGAVQPKMARYHHLFVIGPYMYRAFVANGYFADGEARLAKVGMPKTDRLLDGSLDAGAIRAALRLDPARPTVMLAPTWLRDSPMNEYGMELIEQLAAGPWNVIIKLHDKFFDPRFNIADWRSRLAGCARRANCRVASDEYDAVPLLYVSDVLISDVSSIANEFALLDRPLVFLRVPEREALAERFPRVDLETWGQRAGEVVSSAAACVAAVERALSDPAARGDIRRALAADIFYNPGSAAPAAARRLYQILGLEEQRSSSVPARAAP
ncbi:MAG: CDP-glycerol glycerophosphotransferase family protein [Planctomycetes bacterium]|nr:CDP-glycerol glycerophosphotransferase family protein [Planctomycetota bacterium]